MDEANWLDEGIRSDINDLISYYKGNCCGVMDMALLNALTSGWMKISKS